MTMTESVISISEMAATPMDENGDFMQPYTTAGIFVKPDPPDEGWGCVFGAWYENPAYLKGFDSSFDAWAFVFAATGINPTAGSPDKFTQWTKKPQPDTAGIVAEPEQMRLM